MKTDQKKGGLKLRSGRFFLFVSGLMFFYTACQNNNQEQPLLSDDKIARIMADLSVADAATNGLTSGYTKDSLMHVYFDQTFVIHGTSLEIYEKDLRILAADLPRMEQIVKKAQVLLTEGEKGIPAAANK
jgi:hypothetical protein